MKKITKDNLKEFMEYYHELHDSCITNINYDILDSKIELYLNVLWSGEPKLKENNTYQTNKVKIKMVFNDVEQCNNKEIFSWDYINNAFIKYIKLNNKELICFASDEKEPQVYIVCESLEYEETK